MTENDGYQKIMACIMSTMPTDLSLVRFKAYVSPESNYMSVAASYSTGDEALAQAPVERVCPELFNLLVSLRKVQQGNGEDYWLTTDMTFMPATGKFTARYGYERPEDGTVQIERHGS